MDEDDYGEALEGGTESPRTRQRREELLLKESAEADRKWRELASKRDWTQVVANLEVFAYSGERVTQNPRRAAEYRDEVVSELGFGPEQRDKRSDLSEKEIAVIREVLRRKAGAFWLEGTPKTTVRWFSTIRYR